MGGRIRKIIFMGVGFLPILFLLMICNKSLESFIALGICNLLAIIAICIGSAGSVFQKNERKTIFLFGSYYSLFAMCFSIIFVRMALQEHIDKIVICVFVFSTFVFLSANIKGVMKYSRNDD